ncbi:conserved Plasmodium protein, unknown function [Plasmodium gallinaceum]|uniref:Uncharacterized protein n=1 Tax=Plasmodium gallinaceum TaxID=5849 RepID=A0A1J1GP31_PLAGA|nr:conserved Plasmodium protein, unknown function [Plasmodium gallinaceum]CRG94226.1 conserved Plasmodium protein, unknown function [Plasmodium gallinaceum]
MPVCFCVYNVCGYNEKYNTILYREPILINKDYDSKYIIFFPGDYSSFFYNSIYTSFKLESKYECTDYCFSYEALFWVISHKYLYDHIIFIKPCTFYNYYATFSNFLPSPEIYSYENTGNIIERNSKENNKTTTNNNNMTATSAKHLLSLLISLNKKLTENKKKYINSNSMNNADNLRNTTNGDNSDTNETNSSSNDNFYKNVTKDKTSMEKKFVNDNFNNEYYSIYLKEKIKKKLVLIGFSKGCTVLISLLREAYKIDVFWSIVDSIFFLDPGFNKNTFNSNIESYSLEKISEYNLKIYIHSTLRQIIDESGSCIHKQLLNFINSLKKFNICVSSYLHYTNVQNSIKPLSLHFEILVDFFQDISTDLHTHPLLLNSHEKTEIKLCNNKKCKENFLFESWRNSSSFNDQIF